MGALSALSATAAEPLSIRFVADRQVAERGETIQWTVWADLPADAEPGARVAAIGGDLRPADLFAGIMLNPTPLVFLESTQPTAYGSALVGLHLVRPSAGGFAPRSIPLYSFSVEVFDSERPLWYDIDATVLVSGPSSGFSFYQREGGSAAPGQLLIRVITDTVNFDGCNAADVAEPFGRLDDADIVRFVELFQTNSPLSDLVAPFGIVDMADLNRFFQVHAIDCYQINQ